ncbi:magnesium chelatase subunit D [Methylobacterium radiotolerans]|uniref:magnesium chelatase subunit D n=1 Tax=Methylobacterium radiotolerans TaxID=31998 RepID=UPI000D5EA832|nr:MULTISPECIES: magnesium chelatase subunit D [Methylobacterium]MDE3748652.1 magnesium chelatase subunit D [Methylobacterium radiotolerans]PVZ06694.1 magnesium chelatase subunit D [Methylobacterium organophilum]
MTGARLLPPPAEVGRRALDLWADARLAARLLAADPHGLGGAVLRASPGPVRERWLEILRAALPPGTPWRRLPPGIGDDGLLGGLDLAATLAAGRPVARAGLLAEADGGIVLVPMAERLPPGTASRLAATLDTGTVSDRRARFGLILLDEGVADETVAEALADRLAFRIDLSGLGLAEAAAAEPEPAAGAPEPDPVGSLCALAEAFGIASLRGPILAARVARALAGVGPIDQAAIVAAGRLVLAPRATRLPAPEQPASETAEAPPAEPPEPNEAEASDPAAAEASDDVVLEAVRAAIPPNLLDQLLAGAQRLPAARAGRVGQAASARTGRPVGSRRGDPRRGRLDLLATLRTAAPWQALRRDPEEARRIVVRRDDLRIRILKQRTETTTVFCVDASGSAALERLAEAKGAVELLLAEAYVRRDRVALVAFRGAGADLVLPPTRSLTRAKRGLSGLPGGGGTPLAAGIDAAVAVALGVRRGGSRPAIVLLTDGRANVARSGEGGRVRAGAEALQAARALRAAGLPALVVDTGTRGEEARSVASAMGARYLKLPRVEAGQISAAVRAAL